VLDAGNSKTAVSWLHIAKSLCRLRVSIDVRICGERNSQERPRTATVVALALVGATTTRSRHLQTYGSFGQFVLVTRLAEMVVLTSFVEIVQVQSVPVKDTTTKPGE